MVLNELGNTGIKVSEIGMGCEGFIGKTREQVREIVDLMEQGGMNCIDLYSPDPQMRTDLGYALAGRRETFVIQAHLCAVWKDGQYKRTRNLDEVKAGFTEQLKLLQTDYADVGMIHYVDSMEDWQQVLDHGVLDYAKQLKREGIIHAIGLSSHNPEVALTAVNTGEIGVLMFSVNPCYDLQPASEDVESLWAEENYSKPLTNMNPEREALYETCQRLGVGITVMKAFGGGDLLDEELSPAGKALTAYQCLSYALNRPAVASVMCGARSLADLKTSIAYEDASAQEKDYAAALAAFPRINWQGHCMYCSHCAPCPKKIDVASVTKFLNLAIAQGEVPETVREHYAVLEHHAEECISCGACETRCPFGVSIMQNMRNAKKIFGM